MRRFMTTSVARLWYGPSVRLCIFDLDHTLIRSPLDLAAMALDMRSHLERHCGPLPAKPDRYRVGELLHWCQAHAAEHETPLWEIALDHERRAVVDAALEPGAREVTAIALERFAMVPTLDLVVTRDEMRALKPDPDGWRVIAAHFGAHKDALVVGDSWVDGVAATAAGIPFVAYRPNEADMTRWKLEPVARFDDLAALPAWLHRRASGGA